MIYLVDTNVLSEPTRPEPDKNVLTWLDENDYYVPSPVLAEIQHGIIGKVSVKERLYLQDNFDAIVESAAILNWDMETSIKWAWLCYSKEVKKRPQAFWDSLIDAMGVRYDAVVVTRDVEGFRHSRTLDPWTGIEYAPGEKRKGKVESENPSGQASAGESVD